METDARVLPSLAYTQIYIHFNKLSRDLSGKML